VHAVATALMESEPWDFTAIYYDGIDHFSMPSWLITLRSRVDLRRGLRHEGMGEVVDAVIIDRGEIQGSLSINAVATACTEALSLRILAKEPSRCPSF